MNLQIPKRLLLFVTFVAVMTLGSAVSQATTISIQPSTSSYVVGNQFDLSVNVSDVTDLYGYQFGVSFDPAVISAVSVTRGPFLLTSVAQFFIPGAIDNSLGIIGLSADTLLGASTGQSGSGSLATISFLALSPGVSTISLTDLLLLDSGFADISTGFENGQVTVTGSAAVPEPSTMLLLVGGLGGLALYRRRARG